MGAVVGGDHQVGRLQIPMDKPDCHQVTATDGCLTHDFTGICAGQAATFPGSFTGILAMQQFHHEKRSTLVFASGNRLQMCRQGLYCEVYTV